MQPLPHRSLPGLALLPAAWLAAACALAPLAAWADVYELYVTRIGNNTYKVASAELMVQTRQCKMLAYAEKAMLEPLPDGGELTFSYNGERCNVRAIYGPTTPTPGNYTITVSYKGENWYESFGTRTYLKTRDCKTKVLGEPATLRFPAGGEGQLVFKDGDICVVEALYGRKKL